MSIFAQAALVCTLLGAPAAGPTPAPNPPASRGAVIQVPPDRGADPAVPLLRAEVERLQEEARLAEAGAPDDIGRLRARVDLTTQLLLLVLRRQDELYVQNQALLAAVGSAKTPAIAVPVGPGPTVVVPPPTRPAGSGTAPKVGRPAGPLFGKRGGDKVHRPGCSAGERIAPSDRVAFASLGQAALAGYSACKLCHPER